MENFQASVLPSDGEDLDEVCNVDVFVTLKDESCWTATVFTVEEVERLMKLWAGTGEASGPVFLGLGGCLRTRGHYLLLHAARATALRVAEERHLRRLP
ncbi:hypothetical protein [Streptomyces sp. NPDC002913]